ncbi:MAG TPA: hypothetical protein PLC98_17065, partial [Anaerolineales bacterium]|nr:hypothetical protein [Anaerolineales bacterium]
TSTTVRAGTAVADYGPANTGAITLSADGAVGSSANISIVRHAGSPWSAQTLLARLGNLNGSYGLATDAHGIGLGDYAAGNYLVYDNSRGFEFRAGAGSVGIDASGIRLTKGSSSAVGALKFYDSTAFSSQVGGLSVDRGTFVDGLLSTDATAFDQYARTYLAAIGDTSAANSRREQYLEVNTGAGSRWGVIVYGGGTDAANGGGLQVSATDQGQVGIVPRGTITAQTALRVGSWASGVFDQSAFLASNALMVRGSSGSGYIYMTAPGEANRTGTVEWYRGDSTRHGYMGYSTPGSLDLVLENGSTLNVIGGAVDLNSGPIWSYDTTTASAAAGGGVVTAIGIADGQMWLVTVTGGDQNWRATVLLGCRSGSAHLHTITNTSICVPSVSSNTLRITNNDPTFSQAFYVRAIRLM